MDGIKKVPAGIHTHVGKYIRTGVIVWLLFLESLRLFSNCRSKHTLQESERHCHKKIADSVSSSVLKAIFCRTSSSSGKKNIKRYKKTYNHLCISTVFFDRPRLNASDHRRVCRTPKFFSKKKETRLLCSPCTYKGHVRFHLLPRFAYFRFSSCNNNRVRYAEESGIQGQHIAIKSPAHNAIIYYIATI